MSPHPHPLQIDAPAPQQLTAGEWTEFRDNCSRLAETGGISGEIARDMLRVGERLTAMSDEIKRFLQR